MNETLKAGWKTSEFWRGIGTWAVGMTAMLGIITQGDAVGLTDSWSKVVGAVFVIIAEAASWIYYTKQRSNLKEQKLLLEAGQATEAEKPSGPTGFGGGNLVPAFFLAVGLWCLGGAVQAAAPPAKAGVNPTCWFGGGNPQPKTDPAVMALLQQIIAQNDRLISMIVNQQQLNQQMNQRLLEQPRQQLPIAEGPRQQLPINEAPRQLLPNEPPRQILDPGDAKPMPGSPSPQVLPTGPPIGYQRYESTKVKPRGQVLEFTTNAAGQQVRWWIDGKPATWVEFQAAAARK